MATNPKPAARKAAAKNGNGAAPRKVTRAQAQKAIAELKDKPKTGEFRGVRFTLPPKLHASFLFDVGEMQAGDGTDFSAVHRLMVGFLGVEQWRAVRDKIAQDGDGIDEAGELMEELFASITDPYGMAMGESEASATT